MNKKKAAPESRPISRSISVLWLSLRFAFSHGLLISNPIFASLARLSQAVKSLMPYLQRFRYGFRQSRFLVTSGVSGSSTFRELSGHMKQQGPISLFRFAQRSAELREQACILATGTPEV